MSWSPHNGEIVVNDDLIPLPRLYAACGECKRRKIRCLRDGPPCSSCIRRNVSHLCDAPQSRRSEPESSSSPSTVQTSRSVSKSARSDAEVEVIAQPDPEIVLEQELFSPTTSSQLLSESTARLTALTLGTNLTSYGTTIVLPPWEKFCESAAPTSLALDLGLSFSATPDQIRLSWIAAVASLHDFLPHRELTHRLVDKYFYEVDWVTHVLHRPSFLADLAYYWDVLVPSGRQYETCPFFLALMFMVLCLSHETGWSILPETDSLAAMPPRWFAAAQRALQLGQWTSRPQLRSLQVIIFFGSHMQSSSRNQGRQNFAPWLGAAIAIAQSMGLHVLGENPTTMPPDDPSLPPGCNTLRREGGLRVLAHLCILDWMGAKSRFFTCMLDPSHITSVPPGNFDDVDISPIDTSSKPAPPNRTTDSTVELLRLRTAQLTRLFGKKLRSSPNDYSVVMDYDRALRAKFNDIPEILTVESEVVDTLDPRTRWKRNLVLNAHFFRFLVIHRPFLSRAYEPGSQFRTSIQICVQAATIVLTATHNTRDIIVSFWLTYSHAFSAALVLFQDLFQAHRLSTSAVELENKRKPLLLALDIFASETKITSPSLQSLVYAASRVLRALYSLSEGYSKSQEVVARDAYSKAIIQITKELRDEYQEKAVSKSAAGSDPMNEEIVSFFADLGVPAFPLWVDQSQLE